MVVKFDLDSNLVRTWSTGARRFVGEPMFVPKNSVEEGEEEDDGYIVVVEYAVSVERCYLVILDAKKIGESDAVVSSVNKVYIAKINYIICVHSFYFDRNIAFHLSHK
ncbi:putative oxidoreductase [Arabidopsis thaliana]